MDNISYSEIVGQVVKILPDIYFHTIALPSPDYATEHYREPAKSFQQTYDFFGTTILILWR
jgi:hypothetical protein